MGGVFLCSSLLNTSWEIGPLNSPGKVMPSRLVDAPKLISLYLHIANKFDKYFTRTHDGRERCLFRGAQIRNCYS